MSTVPPTPVTPRASPRRRAASPFMSSRPTRRSSSRDIPPGWRWPDGSAHESREEPLHPCGRAPRRVKDPEEIMTLRKIVMSEIVRGSPRARRSDSAAWWTWFVGMALFSNALHRLGMLGAPRRTMLGAATYALPQTEAPNRVTHLPGLYCYLSPRPLI